MLDTIHELYVCRDAILVCLMDLTTGLIGGFVVFSVLGHVSYRTGIDIKEFSKSGKNEIIRVRLFSGPESKPHMCKWKGHDLLRLMT